MKCKTFILQIIKTRKFLLKSGKNFKNEMKCIKIIADIENNISFYGKKWDDEGWKNFLRRKKDQIEFLIPGNKSEKTYLETLNELIT